jgi:hypothetical protein
LGDGRDFHDAPLTGSVADVELVGEEKDGGHGEGSDVSYRLGLRLKGGGGWGGFTFKGPKGDRAGGDGVLVRYDEHDDV